jgi:hypothetical protein
VVLAAQAQSSSAAERAAQPAREQCLLLQLIVAVPDLYFLKDYL